MKDNKLKGKDLINIGIYAAIYCVLMTCIAIPEALKRHLNALT